MKRPNQPLSLLLALLLSIAVFLPSVALAGPSTQTELQPFLDEYGEACPQLVIGKDSNSFQHAHSDFPSTYQLSTAYLNQLLSLGSYADQLQLLAAVDSKWKGSCFGIASTIILNKVSKVRSSYPYALNIDAFQDGAQNYFDLEKPVNNRPVLDMINYYMLSQYVSPVENNTIKINIVADPSAGDDSKLANFVTYAKDAVERNEPALFCYYYNGGGHAVILCDYITQSDGIIFKIYDENDRTYNMQYGRPRFAYLKLKNNGTPDTYTAKPDNVKLYYFDYSDPSANSYYEHDLLNISYLDLAALNQYLNIHNPIPQPPTAGVPQFTFSNIMNKYGVYSI